MEPEFNYSSVASIVTAAEKSGLPISAIVLRQQAEQMEQTEESIYEHMRKNYQVMAECIEPGCNKDLKSTSGLTGGSAFKMRQISESGKSLTGSFLSGALYRALAVSELNAAMGRIVAAPTAGSCGILPAALLTMQEEKQIPERDCVMSLFTASAVGMVIANNASLAGAQGGCQAECGSAAAMAAAAIVELAGGTPKMAEHAIAIAIKNILGLVCDPVAGLVEIPCIKRNASGVAGAFVAAELALAGIESAIPADEVIWTMKKVGDGMSSTLKETAEGGLAATPTGRRLHEHVFGTALEAHSGCSGCGGCSS
ncbi:L-serine dehydratase, iron-sulfur-dependent subunit alpha [Enterocloster clostridioformis]|uniref:L-serine ammonia-lyase, iron-sulfur-dependent, subunit alpha n=1 Tax=Enterocloster clostridioformis TaxID=1531 RepID=UPI00080CBBD7|nr:L-serine ammonia-lyase, iron-sulfur-dependent, subunit alpha [Enterocloster clostridioformis]ANU49977.1 L-serine dehydratase, iron-sulfur-dependent subunit alpha [Lachnoclostridium sp. YL32]NDO28532.1 L-serine ammonia-lyase, iron-sulfur-dependent, subunit alpha [Enterocloster clostridioformis]OXE70963.1 L-serine dehydratase, iron-sulfur-dependent subunit alpha [Enterocloster clostridioformis]QQR01117.1 L-serine ammonia-lyase, iron-sulfur-dependent, subunit alpha [Enterocloster clostridioform